MKKLVDPYEFLSKSVYFRGVGDSNPRNYAATQQTECVSTVVVWYHLLLILYVWGGGGMQQSETIPRGLIFSGKGGGVQSRPELFRPSRILS